MTTFARDVVDVPVASEMSESFLAYSLSVITSRAIPDVRDGLKPVQRRILHAMADMGLRPDRPHRKSAGVVGETMGKYHPHGDSAIYDALVRLGQDFSRNITLVDPHGNFGTLDDPPAAYRYTECRLADAAMEMIAEIDEDTVEFRPTFDGERQEPTYLPARLPNLLVNGTSGIAVGMATNMPTHNLREVCAAVEMVMRKRRPKPTVEQLMEVLPGPDFPSGGTLINDGLADAYRTGRGSFRIRARAEIEKLSSRRNGIVVTELPYLVGPERVIGRIQELVNSDKLQGISGIKNLSDRKSGLRIVIECKTAANPEAVLSELYRHTPLEESYGVNNVVLVDGVPKTIGLYDLCRHYIDHRLDVVTRRTRFRLEKAQDRLHIVEGLLIALDAIDTVVEIIRGSQDANEAKGKLMKRLKLSEAQATHILDMQLRRLTALETLKLTEEAGELRARIDDYRKILKSEPRRRTIVLSELQELVERFGTDRRTQLMSPDEITEIPPEALTTHEEAVDEPCLVTLSTSGMVGREPLDGPRPATFGRHDVLVTRFPSSTAATLRAVTSKGRALAGRVADIAPISGRSRGVAVAEVFDTDRGEEVLDILAPGSGQLVLVSANGVAKRMTGEELAGTKSGGKVINLKPHDRVVAAFPVSDRDDIVMVSSNAQALRTPVSEISIQGRNAAGVAGMRLKPGAHVVGAGPALPGGIVLTVSDRHTAKVTAVDEIPTKGRAGAGIRIMKFKSEKCLDLAFVGPDENLNAVVGQTDAPSKPDPSPEPLTVEPTRRDLQGRRTSRRILRVGFGRW